MHIQTETLQLSNLTECVALLGKAPKIPAGVTLRGLEKQGVGVSACANTVFHMSRLKNPSPRSSYRRHNKHGHALKSGLHQCMCAMECHCVFSVPLSPKLLLLGRAVIERTHPLFLIWKATCALKGTQVCLCLLTHEHLNNSAASEQNVFISFAVKKQQPCPFPHLQSSTVPLPAYLPRCICCLGLAALYLLPPSLPYPHISIFGGSQLKLCLVFQTSSLLVDTCMRQNNCDVLPHISMHTALSVSVELKYRTVS